jgi:hypothetical protein
MNAAGIASTIVALTHCPQRAVMNISVAAATILVVSWFLAYVLILRTILATSNPAGAIPEQSGALGTFYSGNLFRTKIQHVFQPSRIRATMSVSDHLSRIPNSEEDIGRELAFEQMKLAYIRTKKKHTLTIRFTQQF